MRKWVPDYQERTGAAANRILWSVIEQAKKLDIPCATIHVEDRHPAGGGDRLPAITVSAMTFSRTWPTWVPIFS